jgi:hypothetical protein
MANLSRKKKKGRGAFTETHSFSRNSVFQILYSFWCCMWTTSTPAFCCLTREKCQMCDPEDL